jgi:hypothetical protein
MIPSRLLFGFSIWLLVSALCGCERAQPSADATDASESRPSTEPGETSPRRLH